MAEQNPNLMSPKSMAQTQGTMGSSQPLISEILQKVNNAKDKPKKIKVLKDHDSEALRQILKGAFDPKIEWELPEGTPPYMANEVPKGTEHTYLSDEARRLWHFVKGADMQMTKTQKETMFIQILEALHEEEAKLLLNVKDKRLNKVYKGLTEAVVRDAFNWKDDFTKK